MTEEEEPSLPICHCGNPIRTYRMPGDCQWLIHKGHRLYITDQGLRDDKKTGKRLETFLRDAHVGPFQVRGH